MIAIKNNVRERWIRGCVAGSRKRGDGGSKVSGAPKEVNQGCCRWQWEERRRWKGSCKVQGASTEIRLGGHAEAVRLEDPPLVRGRPYDVGNNVSKRIH